ncbi:DUF397 domain-containing protein [Nonomuraea guangzhouensis]|uniref:DUF397 domain-containing protein n=1 Tax=Nonomuraea guangzhouensis TaxID=1291555 RepID=A0ABW4GUQ5_9ACTN|nr:DUF397 domain-containing protein [Nonomuraea guangzhouensis]
MGIPQAGLIWRKASHSSAEGQNCVEVATLPGGGHAVRDSKDPDGSVLLFTPGEWNAFIKGVKDGEFG